MNLIMFILGLFILVKCADIFVDGSKLLCDSLKIPTVLIGLTIVAFGTSAPEAAISIIASIKNETSIALGNVLGSNICNLLLVLGISSLFSNITISNKILLRDYLFYISSILLLLLLIINPFIKGINISSLNIYSSFILLLYLFIYLFILLKSEVKKDSSYNKRSFNFIYIVYILVGIIGIILGGNITVRSAVNIATKIGINNGIIALSIVAIGTSLPELVTSVIAAKKHEFDIAIGNIIGSNIFNILFILGMASVFSNITISIYSFIDIIIMLIVSLLVFIILLKNKQICKEKGIILILFYFIYIFYILYR